MISHKKIQVTVCTCKPFSHPFCAHSLCQGTNVLESPEYCVENFSLCRVEHRYYSSAPGLETGSRERIVAIHFDADTHRFAVQNHAIQNFLDFLCTSTGEASRV